MSFYDKSFSKKIERLDSIKIPSTTLPQINKSIHIRPISPKKDITFCMIKEESKKNNHELSDYHITPFSPKLKPRNIRIELGENIIRKITFEKDIKHDIFEDPMKRSNRFRFINDPLNRKRLFSHDAPNASRLDIEDNTPLIRDRKFYIKMKNQLSDCKELGLNLSNFQPRSPIIEFKKLDMKKVSRLAQLLKIHS